MSLVEQFVDIIENTRTDAVSTVKKKNAWSLISEQLAASAKESGITAHRTVDQLKKCWTNIKYRQADSRNKQHQLGTGGGPPLSADQEEDLHNRVRAIVPSIDFTLENKWDSTGEFESGGIEYEDVEYLDDNFYDDDVQMHEHISVKHSQMNVPANEKENFEGPRIAGSKDFILAGPSTRYSSNVDKQGRKVLSNINSLNKEKEGSSVRSRSPLKTPSSHDYPGALRNRLNKCRENVKENYKKKLPSGIEIEQDIRIKKLEESYLQQNEVHQEKIKIIQKEQNYWEKMEESVEMKKVVHASELQAMEAQIKYWDAKLKAFNSHLVTKSVDLL